MIALAIDQTIYDLTSGGAFVDMGYNIAKMVKELVLPLAAATIGILLILEVLKVVFAEGQVSWLKIFKLIIFLVAFREYETLVKGVSDIVQSLVDGLSGFTATESVVLKNGKTINISQSVQMEVDHEIFIVTLAKKAMSVLQLISETLLIAMGPFAIMFSFIPGQESVFNGWLRNLIHVLCWSITFMVLDMITASITAHQIKETAQALVNQPKPNIGIEWVEQIVSGSMLMMNSDYMVIVLESLLVKLIISLGYFSTPWLTSKYFGTTHSGGFTKQMLATAGGVYAGAKLAGGTVVGAVSGVTSSGSSNTINNVVQSGGGSKVEVGGLASKANYSSNKTTPGFHTVNKSEN